MSEQERERVDDVNGALARLEEQVSALHEEVRRIGSGGALPPAAASALPEPGAYAWLGSLDVPVRRRPQLPRLLLESLFLAAAAAAAAIAELDAVAIAGVMVGAWVLVALIEWAASRADSRGELPIYAPAAAASPGADPAWFSPPVEQTLLEVATDDPVTDVTRLPPPIDDDVDATIEQRPAV